MKTEQLNRLLNTACKIITQLEHNADAEQAKKINAMFDEIKYADKIDEEMKDSSPSLLWSDGQDLCDSFDDDFSNDAGVKADLEAQDHDLFGEDKV